MNASVVLLEQLIDNLESKEDNAKNSNTDIVPIKIENISDIVIRDIRDDEYEQANTVSTQSFANGYNDPMFLTMTHVLAHKYYPEAYVAVYKNEIVGLLMGNHRGSYRLWGPLNVLPKYQKNGIGGMLCEHMNKQTLKYPKVKRDVIFCAAATFRPGFYMRYGFQPRFGTYLTHFDIKKQFNSLNKRLNSEKKYIEKYEFKKCNSENVGLFVKECSKLSDSIYKGLDLEMEILGIIKYGTGTCFGLYKIDKLVGFAVISHGKISECIGNSIKIKFSVSINESSFVYLLYSIVLFANQRKFDSIEAGTDIGRILSFKIITDLFGFTYDCEKLFMGLGKCVNCEENEVYDDYNRHDSWIIGDWRA